MLLEGSLEQGLLSEAASALKLSGAQLVQRLSGGLWLQGCGFVKWFVSPSFWPSFGLREALCPPLVLCPLAVKGNVVLWQYYSSIIVVLQ